MYYMSEVGHAKNVANFATAINIIIALGAVYNPSQTLILLTALQAKLTEAENAMAEVDTKKSTEIDADNIRFAEFDGIDTLATRIAGAIKVNINDALFTKNATTIIRKLQGRRIGDAPVDDPSTPDIDESKSAHSVSQQSYDNNIANLAALIALLQTKADGYKPNEEEVKLPTLEAKLATMETKNNTAKIAQIEAKNAREVRDTILYHPETGILNLITLIKAYFLYNKDIGKNSAAYQQLKALKFKKS